MGWKTRISIEIALRNAERLDSVNDVRDTTSESCEWRLVERQKNEGKNDNKSASIGKEIEQLRLYNYE